ncbi:protein TESPA1, partial [Catharus ustulatus]|uniref:protein TESPA1 n=1 Tax=Catharus ustulatus TaxID=91951 RepID=UPI00140C9BDB
MASSVPSDVTSDVTSSSSLSHVLSQWQSDPEAILLSLGFAGPDPGVSARVPPRFFSCPSRASGIDLGLFLRAQERRQRMEDTSLQLASRFQQFQALAATADAFFCLYSHVSRIPLQRIAAPRPYRDIPDSVEPRLKRAVTSLCLYTGRGHGDIPGGGTWGVTPNTPGVGGLRKDRDTRRLSATWDAVGTAWGHPERCCPHIRGGGGAGGDTRDTRGVGDTPESPRGHPGGTPGTVPKNPERRGEEERAGMEEVLSEEDDDDD